MVPSRSPRAAYRWWFSRTKGLVIASGASILIFGCGVAPPSGRPAVSPVPTPPSSQVSGSPSPATAAVTSGGPALGGRVVSWTYELLPVDFLPEGLTHETPIVEDVERGVRIDWVAQSCTPRALDGLRFIDGPAGIVVQVVYTEGVDCPAVIAYGELLILTDGTLRASDVSLDLVSA